MRVKYCCDAKAYENYYLSQVGHGMPYFAGARVQQGYGLGNLFSSIAKSILPLVKKVPKPSKNKFCKAVSTLLPTSYRVKTSNKLPSTKPKQQVRISCKRSNESEMRHRKKYKRRNTRNITTFLREPWQR